MTSIGRMQRALPHIVAYKFDIHCSCGSIHSKHDMLAASPDSDSGQPKDAVVGLMAALEVGGAGEAWELA